MKKLLCLICLVLLLAACTSDSNSPTTSPVAPPATPPTSPATSPPTSPTQQVAQGAIGAGVVMGNTIYQQNCRSCHDTGLMGAAKLGDERFLADIEIMVENSINGIGQMPARGGNSSLTDAEVRAAVEYMVDQSK